MESSLSRACDAPLAQEAEDLARRRQAGRVAALDDPLPGPAVAGAGEPQVLDRRAVVAAAPGEALHPLARARAGGSRVAAVPRGDLSHEAHDAPPVGDDGVG